MNSTYRLEFLAAINDAGILLHDIIGAVVIAALLLVGFFLYKRQRKMFESHQQTPDETRTGQKIGRMQMWIVYFLAVAVAAAYFFIVPRATSFRAQEAKLDGSFSEAR